MSNRLVGLGFPTSQMRFTGLGQPTLRPNHHDVGHTIAHQRINVNGIEKNLIFVVIRGTNEEEWFSNFEIGSGITHYGFSRAEQNLRQDLTNYMNVWGLQNPDNNIILITGHSRGAAVANLLAGEINSVSRSIAEAQMYHEERIWSSFVRRDNLFVYTFATPNTTRNPIRWENIHNFINEEDFVVHMPLDRPGWGFARHGITYSFPSRYVVDSNVFESTWLPAVTTAYRALPGPNVNPFFNPIGNRHVQNTIDNFHSLARTQHDFNNTTRRAVSLGIWSIPIPMPFVPLPPVYLGGGITMWGNFFRLLIDGVPVNVNRTPRQMFMYLASAILDPSPQNRDAAAAYLSSLDDVNGLVRSLLPSDVLDIFTPNIQPSEYRHLIQFMLGEGEIRNQFDRAHDFRIYRAWMNATRSIDDFIIN